MFTTNNFRSLSTRNRRRSGIVDHFTLARAPRTKQPIAKRGTQAPIYTLPQAGARYALVAA